MRFEHRRVKDLLSSEILIILSATRVVIYTYLQPVYFKIIIFKKPHMY